MLAPPDRQEVIAAARRFFAAGLCCAVETERKAVRPGGRNRWEPRLLVFRAAAPDGALAAVEDTIARQVDQRVRLTGYCPSRLMCADIPAPIVCSQWRAAAS